MRRPDAGRLLATYRKSARIIAAPLSATAVGEFVLPEVMVGMTEASTTRSPASPCNRNRSSTTARGSLAAPILAVPTGWKIVVPISPAAFASAASSSPTAGPGRNSSDDRVPAPAVSSAGAW